jgi:multidrug resistance efflux pump
LIGALFVYALALGALSLSVPVAVQVLVNTIAFGSLLQPLVILALLLLGVLCLSGGVKLMELYAVELLQRRLFARVAEDLSRRLSSLTQEGVDKVRKKGLANRFFEVVTLQKATSKLLADGLSLALQATVGLLLLGFYHPILLIFDVALLTGVGAIVLSGWGAVPSAVRESEAKYEVAGWLERLARGEESDVRDAEVLTRQYLSARRLHYRRLARQLVGGVALQILAMVGLLGLGGWLVMKGELTLGQLVAAELVVGSLGASFVKLGPLFEGAYDLLASVDKLGKIIDLPQAPHTERAPQPQVASALPAAGSTHGLNFASRALGILALLAGLGLGFTPWQQSVTGSGRVVAYAPLERQQVVEAPIEGRVMDWFVQEGSEVKAGDPIAELSDNDPEILGRLERERAAAQAQVEAATLSIELTEARIRSEESARGSSISTALMKINMARDKVSAAERSVDAAEATLQTARLNLKRQRRLQKKGLSSQRELEVAELTERKARNDLAKAKASLRVAQSAVKASQADQNKVGSATRAKIESTRSSLEKLKADRAKAEAELAKVEVRLARQNQMKVLAPRDGIILRLLAQQGTEMVKAGDPLVTLVPSTEARAVEVYVDGNDAPLIEPGREVRLQFEGWPAVQFVGWPSVAVGTFGGLVSFVDAHGDKYGRFRVVVTPKEGEAWPEGRYLRQGVRANGWILLNQVSLGFELWRQFNGFPPALSHPEDEHGEHKGDKKSSSSKGSSKDKGGSK